jgi:hypothetical protein
VERPFVGGIRSAGGWLALTWLPRVASVLGCAAGGWATGSWAEDCCVGWAWAARWRGAAVRWPVALGLGIRCERDGSAWTWSNLA